MNSERVRAAVALGVALALGGAASAFAAGGSGGGGGGGATGGGSGGGGSATGGGGGGGGSTSTVCGGLSVAVTLTTTGQRVLSGSTSKACDALPVTISFTDVAPVDGCSLWMPTYGNPMYFKYGLKPPSRYENFGLYADPTTCSGTSHTIQAVMADRSTGAVYGTASTTWTAP